MLTKDLVGVVSHPKLKGSQCDRLIKLLVDHEAHALDGYSEASKAEYLTERRTLYDAAGRPGDPDRAAADKAKAAVFDAFAQFNVPLSPDAKQAFEAMKAELPKATPEQFAEAVADINTHYRNLVAAAKLSDREKQTNAKSASHTTSDSKASAPIEFIRFIRRLEAERALGRVLIQQLAKSTASLHGLEALAAIRRWQIAHKSLPRNLAAACREAGLKAVPIDPFSGQPMKFVVQGGHPVVYSVGKDGKDDGGTVDSKNDSQPGDLIYRLSPAA